MADRRARQRERLQRRLRLTWLQHVALLDAKLGFTHDRKAVERAGADHGTVCLVRSLVRHLGKPCRGAPSFVLMVLHDIYSPCDQYLQAIFTANEMRQHFADHEVLSDVHMQREVEAKLDRVPHDHVIVVHIASVEPLCAQKQYKLTQPHDRYNNLPICYVEQDWFRSMARIVVRE